MEKFSLKRKRTAPALCAAAGALSLIFATTAADIAVEISDKFINFYNVIILCVAECLALGFSPEGRGIAQEINRYSKKLILPPRLYKFSVKFLCPAVLLALAVPEAVKLFTGTGYPPWAQLAFGWGGSALVFFSGTIAAFVAKPRAVRKNKRRIKT